MLFSLALCIILFIVMFFVAPIVCYLLCKRPALNKLRYLFLALYSILLLVGVTCHIEFVDGGVDISYQFAQTWGDKNMYWGFADLTLTDFAFNILMLIPIGAYIASSDRKKKWWQVILYSMLIGLFVSLAIEATQFILPVERTVQFSDTFFNTLSAGLGAIMIVCFKKLRCNIQKSMQEEENKKDGI